MKMQTVLLAGLMVASQAFAAAQPKSPCETKALNAAVKADRLSKADVDTIGTFGPSDAEKEEDPDTGTIIIVADRFSQEIDVHVDFTSPADTNHCAIKSVDKPSAQDNN